MSYYRKYETLIAQCPFIIIKTPSLLSYCMIQMLNISYNSKNPIFMSYYEYYAIYIKPYVNPN